MKKFLLNCILYCLPLILLLGAVEFTARAVPNIYKDKLQVFEENKNLVETLIIGGSHFDKRLDPYAFKTDTINCAIDAQTHRYDYLFLKQNIAEMPRLKLVLLPVSYLSLFYDLESSTLNNRCIRKYQIYMGYSEHSVFSTYNYEISDPAEAINNGIHYFFHGYMPIGRKGERPLEKPLSVEEFKKDVKRKLSAYTFSVEKRDELLGLNLDYLKK